MDGDSRREMGTCEFLCGKYFFLLSDEKFVCVVHSFEQFCVHSCVFWKPVEMGVLEGCEGE